MFSQPLQTMLVVGFVVAGVPVYYLRVRGRGQAVKRELGEGGGGRERSRPWWKFWAGRGR